MEDSQLNLPHSTVEPQLKATLKDALAPFAARQDLSDVWFAMPQNSTPQELQGLIHTAWWLGGLSSGVGFAPRVTTGVISDTTQLTSYQVIAFGRPTDNPAIALMNDYLPQPFMPGEDSLRQQVGNVVYRLPSSFSLGLLQALSAPWNPQKAVLVVTGTTPEGVIWAINTLTSDETYYGLKGDLAYIRGERIESFESTKFIRPPLENAVEAINQGGENISLESAPLTPTPQAVSSVEPSISPQPTPVLPTPTKLFPTPTHPALTAATPPALIAPTRPISTALVPGEPISVPSTPGPIPEEYLPQGATPPPMVNYLIIGLIGAGLLVAAVGIFFNWRKTKIRNLS
jgi:hypothetical protein